MIETGTLDDLRHLTRTNMLVETKKPITLINEFKGIHDLVHQGKALSFQVDAEELDNVIKHISRFGIVKLESAPPTLEELFMRYYEQKDGSGAGGGT